MKFLADENIGLVAIKPLKLLGFDIKSVLETQKGMADADLLFLANRENRIVITADKDFGELVYVNKLANAGVILLRLANDSSQSKLNALQALLKAHARELENAFTVVTENKVRIRKIDLTESLF